MHPTITVFANSPDQGRGLARDMPVRWALEETGTAYRVRLVTFAALKEPPHLALQPFGQIPTYEEDGLMLFESAAIVHHIAASRPGLLPTLPGPRARATAWMFSAVATIEPPIVAAEAAEHTEGGRPWHTDRYPILKDRIAVRLADLSRHLKDSEWLDGAFSAGDLIMVSVLRRLEGSSLLAAYQNLSAYVARAKERDAFKRAFQAQKRLWERSQSAGST